MGSEDLQRYVAKLTRLGRPHDVVTRVLTVSTADGGSQTHEVAPQDVEDYDAFPEFEVPEGSHVRLNFTDVDDAGNSSAPLEYEFDAFDATPPNQPEGLAVDNTGETAG